MKVFGVSTIRNAADIVRVNILHHLSLGLDSLLIIDNESSDGTDRQLQRLSKDKRVRWHRDHSPYRHSEFITGLAREAFKIGADWVVQMDADFSHPPDALPALLSPMEDHDAVMGSRYLNGITVVNWPIERILISYFGNVYARFITGLSTTDATGGFRCIRRELLEQIGFERIQSDGYAFQIEMNYRFDKYGARIKELSFFFVDRTRGESKLDLSIAFEAVWIVWWLRIADALGRI